jgi:hypothetical protein
MSIAAHIYAVIGMIGIGFFVVMFLDIHLEKKAEKKRVFYKTGDTTMWLLWICFSTIQMLIFYSFLVTNESNTFIQLKYTPVSLPNYDYNIELDRDSIHIDTKDGRCFIYHADSISLDEFIIKDNL